MKDVFGILNDAWKKYNINSAMDVRVTMSSKGIKVNLGLGAQSNKPTDFNLINAVTSSVEINLAWFEKILTQHNNNEHTYSSGWIQECITLIEMLLHILNKLKSE